MENIEWLFNLHDKHKKGYLTKNEVLTPSESFFGVFVNSSNSVQHWEQHILKCWRLHTHKFRMVVLAEKRGSWVFLLKTDLFQELHPLPDTDELLSCESIRVNVFHLETFLRFAVAQSLVYYYLSGLNITNTGVLHKYLIFDWKKQGLANQCWL